jgi:hypothetical protein
VINPNDFIEEEKIPWHERITLAVGYAINSIASGLISLLLAPVIFAAHLFTSKRMVLNQQAANAAIMAEAQEPPAVIQHEHRMIDPGGEDDDWMKDHKKEFGS